MSKEDLTLWLEVGRVAASVTTPLIVAILGIILLRRIEGVKAEVTKQSEFHKKWAEQFFACCQEFLNSLERELAVLTFLAGSKNPNDELGTELQRELSRLHPIISELDLRIRRSVVFAPSAGPAVIQAAKACLDMVASLVTSRKGDVDEIIAEMNEFNIAARRAHAEMLGIGSKSDGREDGSK